MTVEAPKAALTEGQSLIIQRNCNRPITGTNMPWNSSKRHTSNFRRKHGTVDGVPLRATANAN